MRCILDIYVDASYCQRTNKVGIGIVHKDYISAPTKARSSLAAEIIAVIRAVHLSKPLDKIFTDCIVIVNAIKKKYLLVRHEFLCECLYKLIQLRNVTIHWIKRDKNKIADNLARKARKS